MRASSAVDQPSPTAVKSISALVGVVSLGVLIQAATGGLIVRETRKSMINAHSGLAYVVAVVALGAMVVALVMWRGKSGGQVVVAETVALFLAVVIQIGIGQQIGDLGASGKLYKTGTHPGLLAIHVPLALLIFGLGLHLSTYVANIRRGVH